MKKRLFPILLLMTMFVAAQAQEATTAASVYNEGLAIMKTKDYAKALPLLEKAISIASTEATADEEVLGLAKKNAAIATYYVGNAKRKAKALDEASALYEKGIGYNPASYINYIGRAQVLSAKGDKAAAVKAYFEAAAVAEKAGKADKANSLIANADKLSRVAYSKKNYDQAIACAEAFLAGGHETARTHFTLARALKAKKQYKDAAPHIDKAVEMATGNKDKYYYTQGQIYEALGNKAKAIAAYKKVKGEKYSKNAQYKVTKLGGK